MRKLLPALIFALAVAVPSAAQAPGSEPKINLQVVADGTGRIKITGDVTVPTGWKLSIHTLTVRHKQTTGSATLNALIPVKGGKFDLSMKMTAGQYSVWGVIDVKDNEGREKQISSESTAVTVN